MLPVQLSLAVVASALYVPLDQCLCQFGRSLNGPNMARLGMKTRCWPLVFFPSFGILLASFFPFSYARFGLNTCLTTWQSSHCHLAFKDEGSKMHSPKPVNRSISL